jgi:hypothetical protein
MIIEIAQILCSVHILLDNITTIDDIPLYRLTHKNHPCNIWARSSSENYKWLYSLFCELCSEYTYRYEKIHLTEKKLKNILSNIPQNIPISDRTPFVLAMPDECKMQDPVDSYRNYYIIKKQHISTWTKRDVPKWFNA